MGDCGYSVNTTEVGARIVSPRFGRACLLATPLQMTTAQKHDFGLFFVCSAIFVEARHVDARALAATRCEVAFPCSGGGVVASSSAGRPERESAQRNGPIVAAEGGEHCMLIGAHVVAVGEGGSKTLVA